MSFTVIIFTLSGKLLIVVYCLSFLHLSATSTNVCKQIILIFLINSEVPSGKNFKCTGGIMASEAVLLFRTFYEQGNPNGKLLWSFLTSTQNLLKLYDIVDMWFI